MRLEGRARTVLAACWPIVSAWAALQVTPSIPRNTAALITPSSQTSSGVAGGSTHTGAQVRGTLSVPDRRPLLSGALVLSSDEDEGSASAVEATVLPDGSFVFDSVQPGTYQIRALARTDRDPGPLFALFRVVVRDRNVDGLRLRLLPTASISGSLRTAGAPRSARRFAGARVAAPFADGSRFGEALAGDVLADGSFTIRGVMAGLHVLVAEALPAPWVVQRITYRGEDITDIGIQTDAAEQLQGVEIAVTDVTTELSGVVRDGDGHGATDALVLVVPQGPGLWPLASRRFGRVRTGGSGDYRLRGLPAGDYRLAAFRDLDDRAGYRRDIIRFVRDRGTVVRLEASGTQTINPSLSSPPSPSR